MEDSFRVRVDKIFGSLSSSSASSSSSLRSLWCLTDDELEKREWNRDKGSPETEASANLFPSNSYGFFANEQNSVPEKSSQDLHKELEDDLQDLDDRDDDRYEPRPRQSRQDEDEWEIRSSIGLDCTLDNEEEEDEYDKVAVGKEKAGDRLFMSNVNDYGIDVNTYKVLPDSFGDAPRDPRANHMAAKCRLKEDAEAAKNFTTLQVSDKTGPAVADTQVKTSEDGVNPRSILKRKESQTHAKSEKRVRFDPGCKNNSEEESEGAKDTEMETSSVGETIGCRELQHHSIPDYVRNPSSYTCYTLDSSSEIDDKSNRQAYMDFLNTMKGSNARVSHLDETPVDLPKSVTFTPRKKASDPTTVKSSTEVEQDQEGIGKESVQRKGLPICIAVGDAQESEVSAMEEDSLEIPMDKANEQRRGRRYRTKVRFESDESIA
ncbi:uncharacterized protein LOC131167722 [Malania oleifera]|uniref:uncharacterized protein LOC131167722 n=1 Tax=Malania oleifera TaxID=397392 RepID=UPI0025ADC739|nr:uncharacterized protein LOC131167722 [Malania oleifera]